MSGHSKWSQIKRKKEIKDIEKGKIFSKISRLITLAVKEGGGTTDPEKNIKLRLAVERAKSENMPKDNIARSIEKATRGGEENLRAIVYEGFGPGGIALLITGATDNPSRAHSQVKSTLERIGGKLGGPNCVNYLFDKCGVVVFKRTESDESKIFSFADKIQALDIDETDGNLVVYIPFSNIGQVDENLDGLKPETVDVFYRPKNVVKGEKDLQIKLYSLIESLESLDDVERVYSNFEIGSS